MPPFVAKFFAATLNIGTSPVEDAIDAKGISQYLETKDKQHKRVGQDRLSQRRHKTRNLALT